MSLIYHLVKIKLNTHGQLEPINHDHCPIFKEKQAKSVCQDGENYCSGIEEGNVIKQLNQTEYLIQCSYSKVNRRNKE